MGAGWLAGVAINLVGSIMINAGTNIMKMGHNKLAVLTATSPASRPAIYKLREWQIGVSLFSVGNVANFVSFGYAAQSLLAAIGCVQFVSNVVFASFVLREQVSRGVLLATAFIVAGCVLLVFGGSHASQKFDYKDLLHLYSEPAYISYLSVGGAAVVATYTLYWIGQKAVMTKGPHAAQAWNAALPVLYSVFSALIGTQSVLFSKTMAVLLRSTFSGDNQLGKWFTWLVLLAFLMTAVFWVTRLNKGLKMFPALVIVPSLQICWTLFSILSGMLYFKEYVGMEPLPTALFVVGVAVVFAGVFLLTRASQASGPSASTPAPLRTKVAVVGDGGYGRGSTAAADAADATWELQAVRHQAPGGDGGGDRLSGLGVTAFQPPSRQQQRRRHWQQANRQDERAQGADDGDGDVENDDEEDEEDYERALLSATSFTTSHQLQHQHTMQQGRAALGSGGASAHGPLPQLAGAAGRGADADALAVDGIQPQLSAAAEGAAPAKRARGAKGWLHKASSLKRRVAHDFSLDEGAAARLALGLGDSHMPGFSLFAMPVVDLAAGPAQGVGGSEVFGGRPYGRLAESSMPGAPPQQVIISTDGAGSSSHTGGACYNRASDVNQSFLHPPPRSSPSVEAGGQPQLTSVQGTPAGPIACLGINPLSNAIDVRTSGPGSAKAPSALTPQGSIASDDGQKQLSSGGAASKWRSIRCNLKELTDTLQTNVGSGSGAGGRAYERMTSREEVSTTAAESRRASDGTEEL